MVVYLFLNFAQFDICISYFNWTPSKLRNDGIMKYTILDSTNKTATWKYKVSSHQMGRRNEDNK